MLRSLAILTSLFAAAFLRAAEPAPGTLIRTRVNIRDGGAVRAFEIARDEIGTAAGRGSLRKVAPQRDAESLRKFAREAGADLVLYEKGKPRTAQTRRWLTSRVLVKLASGANVAALAKLATRVERPDYAPGYAILDAPAGAGNALTFADWLRTQPGVESAEPLLARVPQKRFTPNDPFFADDAAYPGYQWHLHNLGTRGGVAGVDLNVMTAWDAYRGAGVRIGIIDDGLQTAHPDLAPNADTANDRDFNDNDDDPSPAPDDIHGTSLAGLVAGRGNNGVGVCGVAPEASLVGLRLLGGPQSDAMEASTFAWKNDLIPIKSISWGPSDDGSTIDGPSALATAALQAAISTGRGGKGTLFFWAGGNGGEDDNSNFDGYANSIYVSAIGAITDAGTQAYYNEEGANLIGVVPSDGGAQMVTTTDVTGENGYNDGWIPGNFSDDDYTNDFGGTSAVAPLASGVAALMLQANPNLGWRDVQEILIRTATKIDPVHTDWANNGAGFHFNHRYGAGLLNATAAVNMAIGWTNLAPMQALRKTDVIPASIPDAPSTGITKTFTFSAAENLRVEHATVTVDITHAERGTLEIELTSPSGMKSLLAAQRANDVEADLHWTFSTVHHWGESAAGTWTLRVRDMSIGTTGALNNVTLALYGTGVTPTAVPVITSATNTSGNAGSGFSFQVTASNVPSSFNATGLPAGLSINPSTGLISGTVTFTGAYSVNVSATNSIGTGNAPLLITMGTNFVSALGDALDQPALAWDLDLPSPWTRITGASPTTHDGVDAARSATIADNGSTRFSLITSGPQVVRFWWKVSSEADFDFLTFSMDGLEQAAISGVVNWEQRAFILPAGSHDLTWSYEKDVSTSVGSDAGWVDQVTFAPFASSAPVFTKDPDALTVAVGGTAAFTCAADGPGTITYQWQRNGSNIGGATSHVYVIPTVVAATHAGTYTCIATNANGPTTSRPAVLTVPTANTLIANAVDSTGLFWALAAGPAWTRNTVLANTHDNVDSAQATGLIANQQATISTTVVGPGTVSFWWRSDGTEDEDVLGYNVDGFEEDYITASGGWLEAEEFIPAGLHTISWTYYAGAAGSGASGRGLLDQVVFTPTPYGVWQAAKFTLAQRLDDQIAGAEADPDADGITNLAEHFFGLPPLTFNSTQQLKILRDGAGFALTYTRDTTASSATLTVEESLDLHNWNPISTTDSVLGTIGTVQTIKSVLPASATPGRVYRLNISLDE
jgi:subtilisin-like proprotein convertase family protein